MKRLTLISFAVLAIMGLMPSAQAVNVSKVVTCKTYHSFNGNAKVSVCVTAFQDNDANRIWVGFTAGHVTGFQSPNSVYVHLLDWTSKNGTDPWCDGLAPGCRGDGDNNVFGGVPLVLNTSKLSPTQHYCFQHGEANMVIDWPGGGESTPILNSPTTDTIGAGCILF
jgi:hypothetical protein